MKILDNVYNTSLLEGKGDGDDNVDFNEMHELMKRPFYVNEDYVRKVIHEELPLMSDEGVKE